MPFGPRIARIPFLATDSADTFLLATDPRGYLLSGTDSAETFFATDFADAFCGPRMPWMFSATDSAEIFLGHGFRGYLFPSKRLKTCVEKTGVVGYRDVAERPSVEETTGAAII